jgi:hypothetical protein
MLTPYLSALGPSAGTDCLPSLMLLSIMTPQIMAADAEVGEES